MIDYPGLDIKSMSPAELLQFREQLSNQTIKYSEAIKSMLATISEIDKILNPVDRSAYIFAVLNDDGELKFGVVSKSYFNEHGCLSDVYDDYMYETIPSFLSESSEGVFLSELSDTETVTKMTELGYVYSQELENFLSEC